MPKLHNWTYVWGVDPIWKGASNELMYYNSVKMKGAVIIGVMQMTLGLVLHLLNSIYFRNWLDVAFEFFPRFFFLMSTFGYLVFMIFYKWNHTYMADPDRGVRDTTNSAPVLLNELIYMFLPGPNDTVPLYSGQKSVQKVLYWIIIISVPFMAIPKPLCIYLQHKSILLGYPSVTAYLFGPKRIIIESHVDHDPETTDTAQIVLDAPSKADEHGKGGEGGGHNTHVIGHKDFDISEVVVHQSLETIEFVLGSVSHTASYLRLWALSLAHSELATVFWDKIFGTCWELAEGRGIFMYAIMSFVAVSAWFTATLCVIMFMEVLSAFLHALRLHWVEFQSKFYRGDGHPFLTFDYNSIEEP